jgi:toxin CptA
MAQLLAQPVALFAALLAAAGMGFAIQQGGTCMVSALEHLVRKGSAKKLLALAECSLWTSALGLAVAAAGFAFLASPAYPLGPTTLAGGLLLGAGAWLNGACVFGSIARIGGRDWHYLLTPPGYFVGGLVHYRLLGGYAKPLTGSLPVDWIPIFAVMLGFSLAASALMWRRSGRSLVSLWDYRHATIAIGLAFVVLTVVVGPWTYTEALGRVSHGLGRPDWTELALFAALLGGAVFGGRGVSAPAQLDLRRALLCLSGGALMGFGGSLVPGGNDNLILVGLPGLQPHAWVAIGAMALAIAAGLLGEAAWRRVQSNRSGSRVEPV